MRSASCFISASGWRAPMREPTRPADNLAFDPGALNRKTDVVKRALVELQRMKAEMEAARRGSGKAPARQGSSRWGVAGRCAPKSPGPARENEERPDTHDYSRGRNPRSLYRPAAARGRLGASKARRPRIPRRGHAEQRGHRLCRLRAVGCRRQAARPGRGQAHPQGRARGPAAGQALCRLPGSAVRPASGDLLLQRL